MLYFFLHFTGDAGLAIALNLCIEELHMGLFLTNLRHKSLF